MKADRLFTMAELSEGSADLPKPPTLCGHRWNHLHAQHLLETFRVDSNTSLFRLIIHVQNQGDGKPHIGELGVDQQCPFEVFRVGDLQNTGLHRTQEDAPGDLFVFRFGDQAVHPRAVDDFQSTAARGRRDDPFHNLHRSAGIIGHRYILAG